MRHRLQRLPDTPPRIARGVAAGVVATFTPFYGLHFVTALLFAKMIRGNLLASMLTTFVGNPLTFPLIAAVSLELGHLILGSRHDGRTHGRLLDQFSGAFAELWANVQAIVHGGPTSWAGLAEFNQQVFLPYLVGGLVPGILGGVASYYLTLPLIAAYQQRRRGKLKAKLDALRAKADAAAAQAAAKAAGQGPTAPSADR